MSPWVSARFLQTQSDERLLAAARQGHQRAFEAIVHRYRKPLLGYAKRLLSSDARAEDALQQGLLQAWTALQRGTEVRDVKSWLYRIVHNVAVDLVRRSGHEQEQLADMERVGHTEADLDRRVAARAALAGVAALPGMQREALVRTAVQGHSHEHVAAALGISDGAVRGLIYRARATLRATATAVTPQPVVAWAAGAGRHSAPLAQRLGGVGVGAGGSVGLAGTLLKGGAAVVTAGALAAGAATINHQLIGQVRHDTAHRAPGPGRVSSQSASAVDAGVVPAVVKSTATASRGPASARGHGNRDGARLGGHDRGERRPGGMTTSPTGALHAGGNAITLGHDHGSASPSGAQLTAGRDSHGGSGSSHDGATSGSTSDSHGGSGGSGSGGGSPGGGSSLPGPGSSSAGGLVSSGGGGGPGPSGGSGPGITSGTSGSGSSNTSGSGSGSGDGSSSTSGISGDSTTTTTASGGH